jgi:beta-1,4-mannosyl-glycoprotein beta-1,4-N-acetylglucosaminyltransferase
MLVDTFMFYNELDILELRLSFLDEWVDKFVIVEAEVNHSGGPKELFFQTHRARYEKWLPKIEHIILKADECPKDINNWTREKFQRDGIIRGLQEVPEQAIVMISDVDEIPDLTKIPIEQLPHQVCSVHMWMFEYSFKYIFTGEPWFGTVITTCEYVKRYGPNYFRDNRWKFVPMQYSGWHLSSFGNGRNLANKVNTYAHANDAHEIPWTEETFDELIEKGLHTDGKTALIRRPASVPLPGSPEVLQRLGLL